MEKKKIRILVGSLSRDFGGVESFFLTHLQYIDHTKFQVDFLCSDKTAAREEDFIAQGAKIIHIVRPGKDITKYFSELCRIMKKGKYDVYHVNLTRYKLPLDLICARICGVKVVLHSHSTRIYKAASKRADILRRIEQILFKYPTLLLGNKRVACSENAARYLYSKRECTILYNGVELEKYQFSNEIRTVIRKQLGLEDSYVIGHIGRFSPEKNHEFLLRVFKLCHRRDSKVKLLCIGKGDLFDDVEEYAKKLNLDSNIVFMGQRKDVHLLLSAMDIFCFPSVHEALPITLIEAQANGLECIVSDTVTREIKFTDNVLFLPIEKTEEVWAEKILNEMGKNSGRKKLNISELDSKFSIYSSIKELEQIYNEMSLEEN